MGHLKSDDIVQPMRHLVSDFEEDFSVPVSTDLDDLENSTAGETAEADVAITATEPPLSETASADEAPAAGKEEDLPESASNNTAEGADALPGDQPGIVESPVVESPIVESPVGDTPPVVAAEPAVAEPSVADSSTES